MGLNDEDEDLVALRLAALSTMKAKRASENAMKLKSSSVRSVSIRDNFGNKTNALFQPHFNSNLIAIVPISPSTEAEPPRSRRPGFRHQPPESNKLILPQHRYFKTEEAIPRKKEKPAVKTKFNRYDSSSSDSSEESEDEGSTASGETAAKTPAEDRPVRADSIARDISEPEVDLSPEPSFFVELERADTKQDRVDIEQRRADIKEKDDIKQERVDIERGRADIKQERVDIPMRERVDIPVAPVLAVSKSQEAQRLRAPSPPPARSPPPFYASCRTYADRSRSRTRSRSRSRPRLGRSRSPRRYGPRRSPSPKRRGPSPPRYSPPRRRSPSPLPPRRRSSPSDRPSPGRRRPSSPRRRYVSPSPLSPPSPRRRSSPFDRSSPPRRRSSPWRRASPGRRYSPSPRRLSPPRRRKSPSPVKRNPSPPRRFSPQRRSPLGRRVSPPRRNPSPPRKLYPVAGRPHSPRRYPSPLPARGGLSPRRYNAVGDMSPWSPPRLRSVSPQFTRKRSPLSPRPLPRSNRLTPPPSPLPKRRDSPSPPGKRRRGPASPPRLSGSRRKSVSPLRADRKGPASPRFAPKRRRSFSPRGPRPGSKKRSTSPGRLGNSPAKARRIDERDARMAVRNLRDAATTTTTTTTVAGRDNSKSLSLSPPPDRVKVKSPLRVRAHRHERANGKKRTKSKKSRDKTSVPSAEKTENTGEKSSVLEARRKKFESVDPIRPVNKKIRLKTTTEEAPPPLPKAPAPHSPCTEEGERPDTPDETVAEPPVEEDDDALVLDSPADLWSDEESDSGNEGRFKSATSNSDAPRDKVGVLSFKNLLQPSARPAEPKRARERTTRERRAPARDKKRRRDRGSARPGSVLDRIGERGATWRQSKEAALLPDGTDRLPALLSKEFSQPEKISASSDVDETAPDSTGRVSRLDSTDQHGDLRAALSRKRAARSNILFPFKGGDKGKVPGSRLVQSAFLDAVGKKQKRSKKSLPQSSLLQLVTNVAGAGKDARRVTLYNKVKASVKQFSESVTRATDESMLTAETRFSDDDVARKPPVRLRLGLPQHADDYPGGRKVKLKRNNNNAASDQV